MLTKTIKEPKTHKRYGIASVKEQSNRLAKKIEPIHSPKLVTDDIDSNTVVILTTVLNGMSCDKTQNCH